MNFQLEDKLQVAYYLGNKENIAQKCLTTAQRHRLSTASYGSQLPWKCPGERDWAEGSPGDWGTLLPPFNLISITVISFHTHTASAKYFI
jgi:hypothetical protein